MEFLTADDNELNEKKRIEQLAANEEVAGHMERYFNKAGRIAVIGGGIGRLTWRSYCAATASVDIYEQADELREVGAAVALSGATLLRTVRSRRAFSRQVVQCRA